MLDEIEDIKKTCCNITVRQYLKMAQAVIENYRKHRTVDYDIVLKWEAKNRITHRKLTARDRYNARLAVALLLNKATELEVKCHGVERKLWVIVSSCFLRALKYINGEDAPDMTVLKPFTVSSYTERQVTLDEEWRHDLRTKGAEDCAYLWSY